MAAAVATKFSHKLFEPAPMNITETNHCLVIFEKLKIQREQGRFCDVSLKVHGREFPAHRLEMFTLLRSILRWIFPGVSWPLAPRGLIRS